MGQEGKGEHYDIQNGNNRHQKVALTGQFFKNDIKGSGDYRQDENPVK
ncbi:hypothetical protein [Halobacillus naozhouensis]|uniref:Uncharacterized protein n=1 Tax=Halobacillus naozhouensis TaxID=554880 RepID=A0ABY8J2R1_9BACI|nr:hypothetical protein [Halobacillus naozhouensis]WFT75186.1 hypothetical protein P9989_01900 [Halobacillus naozhouensis]